MTNCLTTSTFATRMRLPIHTGLLAFFLVVCTGIIPLAAQGQDFEVSGVVVSADDNEPLPGVNVVLQGTTTGTMTDADGQYELTLPSDDVILEFSYMGYLSQEVPVDGHSEIDVALESGVDELGELVVVGYGVQERSDVTGSIASISRDEIVGQPVYSIDNVLQGLAAGVNVSATGFRPGEASSIRIRGERSFAAGNEPLVVMDGVPIEDGLMELNPRDVQSIEVLKDASATAIYGSRGANGVILVTTRRGEEGRPTLQYSGHLGAQYTFDRIDMMNTEQYAEFVRDAHRLAGTYTRDEDIFASFQMDAIRNNHTTDWQEEVFERGLQQSHSLSLMGGSEDTRYALSGTYDDHSATVINNDYTRHSFRANVDQNVFPWLRTGLTGFASNSVRYEAVGFQQVLRNSPMSNPYDDEGNILMVNELGDRNPLFDMQRENHLDERSRTRVLGSIFGEADIGDSFRLRASFSPDFRFQNDGFYRRDIPSRAAMRERKRTNLLYETTLNYNSVFRETHNLDATALYSFETHARTELRLAGENLPYEEQLFYNLDSAGNLTRHESGLSEWSLESFMLRMNYGYDDRYLFTLTGRVDGSSRLAEGNQYGLFPSAAFAWQIGNEPFMEGMDNLSELKLRFSIGDVGNTAIQPYQTQGTLRYSDIDTRYVFDGEPIDFFFFGDVSNPDLSWERTRTTTLGLDFGLFDHRVSGSVDLYNSDTYDLIMNRGLPYTSGYENILQNIGQTRNQGLELHLSSLNLSTSDFYWRTDLNFSTNRNEIVSLIEEEDMPGNNWFIGESINSHYYWQFDGIWQEHEAEEAASYGAAPGDARIRDVTGDGQISADDRVILGNTDPDWTAGLTNSFSYQRFDFSASIYTVQGTMHQSMYGSAAWTDILSLQAVAREFNQRNVNYWMPDNPSQEFERPRFGSQDRNQLQAFFDTSYIRIRNLTFGYSIPEGSFGAERTRIYASVQNPFTFTSFGGYDPEGARDFDMPNYTTFLVGVDITF